MSGSTIPTAWTFARRELRGGLRGFRVMLACLALGVAGIAAVGSVVAAINDGLAQEGRKLLGGDAEVQLTYRIATDDERTALSAEGDLSEIFDFRGMARTPDGDSALVQAKAVDDVYPLYGEVVLDPPMPLPEAFATDAEGRPGVVVERVLATRLGLEPGDAVLFGEATMVLSAVLESEPDRAAGGFAFGPRLLLSADALEATELVGPGTLYETEYRLRLPEDADISAVKDRLLEEFPEAGWRWRDRRNGAPGVARFVERIGAFLTLVGLAALAVGGVGVGASVRAYLDSKTETIATLKTLGADGRLVMWTYLLQIGVLSALGVAIGLVLGAGAPLLAAPILEARLPVPANFGVYWEPLWEAAIYGLLAAFLFALWPLARAREVRAAGLFRDLVAPARQIPRPAYLAAIGLLAFGVAGAAVVFTGQARLAIGFVAGVAAALALLAGAAWAIGVAARGLARTRLGRSSLPLRLALGSVGGPGGETRGAVLALGLGLTVLTAIGLIDHNLRGMVSDQLPERAPAYFFIDIRDDELPGFLDQAEAQPGVTEIETAPMLRGVLTRINGMTAAEWQASGKVDPEFDWVLEGDRGVTYAAAPPEGTEIREGEWWPEDYSGPNLVSFGEEQGKGLGLQLGDQIAVNVLGREITAEIASFRRVEFREMGINFLMVFDQNVLRGAPHVHIATVYGDEPQEGAYLRALARDYPTVTAIRVEDALEVMADALRDIAAAARAGAVATLVTGLVVLIGAAAAGQQRQIYDAAILKTLGAARSGLLGAMSLRSALLGVAASVVALGAGGLAAWAVLTFVMEAPFAFDAVTAGSIVVGGVLATLITGALFALGPLSARPARVLRARE
ncbi:MAG: FtsX-like permease family protein [Pseudomonadota bacterium]